LKKLLPILLIALFATPAFALTLAEKNKMQVWQEEIMAEAAEFKAACGYDLPVTLDEAVATPFMEQHVSASDYCSSALSAMTDMCANATAKEAIAAKVKSVNCMYKKGLPSAELSMAEDGVLSFSFDAGNANLETDITSFLENNL
jgi:hypothetical protein